MISNLEKYREDLNKLIQEGELLQNSLNYKCRKDAFEEAVKEKVKDPKEVKKILKLIKPFDQNYQSWYSESLSLLNQLLPLRVADFTRLYEKPKTKRKDISYENYVIEDALQSLRVTRGWEEEVVVDASAAVPLLVQQVEILRSVTKRFESTLFDIKQLVQADLFDSELETAEELNKKGFTRGAGAIAGVVLEKHLQQVCSNHNITVTTKKPAVANLQ